MWVYSKQYFSQHYPRLFIMKMDKNICVQSFTKHFVKFIRRMLRKSEKLDQLSKLFSQSFLQVIKAFPKFRLIICGQKKLLALARTLWNNHQVFTWQTFVVSSSTKQQQPDRQNKQTFHFHFAQKSPWSEKKRLLWPSWSWSGSRKLGEMEMIARMLARVLPCH